jgi:hypothetical protein
MAIKEINMKSRKVRQIEPNTTGEVDSEKVKVQNIMSILMLSKTI